MAKTIPQNTLALEEIVLQRPDAPPEALR